MGSSSSTTTSSYLPGAAKAAKVGNTELQTLLPALYSMFNTGLTPQQKAYYTGQADSAVVENTESQKQGFTDSLSRMGNMVGRGATAEGLADIGRGGVLGQAQAASAVTGMDISQRQQNFSNLLAALGLATKPNSSGSTTTSSPSILSMLGSII